MSSQVVETTALSEAFEQTVSPFAQNVIETIRLSDTTIAGTVNDVEETLTLSDTINQTSPLTNANEETIALSDSIPETVTIGNNAVESIALSEATVNNLGTSYAVISTTDVGSSPTDVAVTVAGTVVFVTDEGTDQVSIIDASSMTVTASTDTGTNPAAVAVSADGSTVYTANTGAGTVSVIDAATGEVIETVTVGSAPSDLVVVGSSVYVANGDGTVSVIDVDTNTVTDTITVGAGSTGIAAIGTTVYVTNGTDGTVSVIDTTNNTVTATITVGTGPSSVVAVGSSVYVANAGSGTVSVITGGVVVATITVGTNPTAITTNGVNVYVANQNSNTVSVISIASGLVIATIPAGHAPNGLAATASILYVVGTDGLLAIDIAPSVGNGMIEYIALVEALLGGESIGGGYSATTDLFNMSRYTNFPFNSIGVVDGQLIALAEDGAYVLRGSDDDGVKIVASTMGDINDNVDGRDGPKSTPNVKRPQYLYLSYASSGTVRFVLYETGDGVETRHEFELPPIASIAMIGGRAELDGGIESRFFRFGFENVAGASFAVNEGRVLLNVLQRRA